MDTLTAIHTRRAVRDWSEEDVEDETLTQILEAGRYAPSPLNSQSWHYTVVRNKETIEAFAPRANHGSFIAKANVVIVITASNEAAVDEWLSEHEQHIYSAACSAQNMWLAAWSLGVGVCWVTLDQKMTRTLLHIPENQILIGSLALGYPAAEPAPHKEGDRKALSEIVSYEQFE